MPATMQNIRNLVVEAPEYGLQQLPGGRAYQGADIPHQQIQKEHSAGKEIVGVYAFCMVQGVVPGPVGRICLRPGVEFFPQKESGNHEEDLNGYGGPGGDGEPAVEERNHISQHQLQQIQTVASIFLHFIIPHSHIKEIVS